ncbi:MAG: hypothetical protein A2Z25_17100 [Planctomycetes bacterium RBG_16_55_9]|nr:MAG: hypothetical protein A2Z25_17100 [Planctomycetes bacterium RBG_16_55_9]
MLEKKRQSNAFVLQKANHVGMALFVFVVLAGTGLWSTGNLHFGPRDAAEAGGALDDVEKSSAHDVGSPDDPGSLGQAVCEHGVATIECDRCRFEIGVVKLQPSLAKTLVETAEVQDVARTRTLRLVGQVELDKTRVVDVVPTGAGLVEQVEKLLGQDVAEGDVLAVIHSADLGQAKAEFLQVQARLELATATFEREKDLHDKQVSSKADYLAALNELKAAQAYYAAAERRLRLFGLGTDQIDAVKDEKENGQFAELVLRAPQAGTIIAQNLSVGALVDTTESLYTIADLSNVWVWYDLYERDLGLLHDQISSGRKVTAKVRVKAFEAEVFDGVVDLIGSQIDEHTRTIKVRVQVKNEERKLKPGMFAEAEISVPLKGNTMTVPSSAVVSDEGKTFVFQHLKDDLWIRQDVRVGKKQGSVVEVLDGLPAGATVVARGAFMLKSDILREKMGAGCAD